MLDFLLTHSQTRISVLRLELRFRSALWTEPEGLCRSELTLAVRVRGSESESESGKCPSFLHSHLLLVRVTTNTTTATQRSDCNPKSSLARHSAAHTRLYPSLSHFSTFTQQLHRTKSSPIPAPSPPPSSSPSVTSSFPRVSTQQYRAAKYPSNHTLSDSAWAYKALASAAACILNLSTLVHPNPTSFRSHICSCTRIRHSFSGRLAAVFTSSARSR